MTARMRSARTRLGATPVSMSLLLFSQPPVPLQSCFPAVEVNGAGGGERRSGYNLVIFCWLEEQGPMGKGRGLAVLDGTKGLCPVCGEAYEELHAVEFCLKEMGGTMRNLKGVRWLPNLLQDRS